MYTKRHMGRPQRPLAKIRETAIQSQIMAALDWRGILNWREQPTPVPIRRGADIVGLRRVSERNRGIPDIFALYRGRLIGIEVKSINGRQRAEQKRWQEDLTRHGGIYVLARDWADVVPVLDALGGPQTSPVAITHPTSPTV